MGGVRLQLPPLTDEQRRLVDENHDMIYWFMRKRNLDREEWYGLMAFAFCRAARDYNPDISKFSTLACHYMSKQLLRENAQNARLCRSAMRTVPLTVLTAENDYYDREVESDEDMIAPVEDMDTVDRFFMEMDGHVKRRDLDMLREYLAGASRSEIADRYGITRERVRQIFLRIGRKAIAYGADPRPE